MLDVIFSSMGHLPPIVAAIAGVVMFMIFCWVVLQICGGFVDAFKDREF